jgi:hypothetical protein
MDMKKILQSLDNVSTKPVEGTDSMAKFLRVVREADLNQVTSEVSGAAASVADQINSYIRYSSGLYKKGMSNITIKPGLVLPITFTPIPPTGDSFKIIQANVATANARLPKDLQLPADQLSNMVGGADKPYAGPTLNEGANPHRVTLPVQMAMQHYQQPAIIQPRTRLIDKYFVEAETAILQKKQEEKLLLRQYAQVIAERVMMKEATFATTGGGAATGNPNITNKTTVLPKAAPFVAKPINISILGTGLDTNITVEGVEIYSLGDFLLDLGLTIGIAALGAALSAPTAGTSTRVAFGVLLVPARRAFSYVIKHVSTAAKTHPELVTKEAISSYVKTKSEFFKELIKTEFTARALAFTMGATAGFNTVVGVLEKNGIPLPDWLKKDKPFDPENPEATVKIK